MSDHCRAIAAVLERGRVGETYHVGTGVERSIEEIADGVLDALGKPSSLKTIVPDRPGHDRRYALDWTKIRTELGWEPSVSFDTGLLETVEWYAREPGMVGTAARRVRPCGKTSPGRDAVRRHGFQRPGWLRGCRASSVAVVWARPT